MEDAPDTTVAGASVREPLHDAFGRPLRDLRISLTDRCNLRCTYCMPREVFGPDYAFLPESRMLSFPDILRIARVFVQSGVQKVHLTGGEPLLRRGVETLVRDLVELAGVREVAMTTNGVALSASRAQRLRDHGLRRITISLDALDDSIVRVMNGVGCPVSRVLEAISVAAAAGLAPVKINMVVRRGVNDGEIEPMAEYFRGTGHILRFIEYMDVGHTNKWRRDEVVPAVEILDRIGRRWPLEEVPPRHRGEVATRFRYVDGGGEIGVIASVTRPFCSACGRARLSSEGMLYTCLFADHGVDLTPALNSDRPQEELRLLLSGVWSGRVDRYSELRADAAPVADRVEMSRIGG